MISEISKCKNKGRNLLLPTFLAMSLTVSMGLSAADFEAYPGVYAGQLIAVEATNVIHISVNVWSGFEKTFRVTLQDVVIPEDSQDAPGCQRELIGKGKEFTKKFVSEAKKLQVHSLWMENTAQDNARSKITTEKGSLASALKKEGFARPASVDPKKPWC